MKAVIIGAGPCGLTAAWDLARAGAQVTVIEKEGHPGGLCSTTRRNRYQFDLGGHRFISKDQRLIEDMKGMMDGQLLTRHRKSVIRFCDRQFQYPINPGDILKNSTLSMSARFLFSYAATMAGLQKSGAPLNSFDRWADENFGPELNKYFFKPYTEKLWGIPSGELSGDWASQRISLLNAWDALKRAIIKGASEPRTYAIEYLYPKSGIGGLFDKMEADIESMGGRIIYNTTPSRLVIKNKTLELVEISDISGVLETIEADQVLSTIPLDQTATLIDPDSKIKLSYRSLRFLNMTLERIERLSDNTWMYTPEADIIMTRVQEPKQRSPYSTPAGCTSVMLEIPCQYNDGVWNMEQEKLQERVLKDLGRLGINVGNHVGEVFSTYARHAYPRYDMGYRARVKALIDTVNSVSNLSTAGRQGFFRYIFMDTAMLMGRKWARLVLEGKPVDFVEQLGKEKFVVETASVVA